MNASSRFFFFAGAVLVTLVVFVVDVLTPRGIEVWVFYLPVTLAMVFSNSTRSIAFVAAACSVLVVVGWVFSPPGSNPDWWDVLNRVMGLLAIWLSAGAGLAICIRSEQLATALAELGREVESRKHAEKMLRESEERLILAMESGGLGTRDHNLLNNREIWSETQFLILGYEPIPGGAAVTEMWVSRTHPDDRMRIREAKDHARKERTLYHIEYRLCRPDTQKTAWVEVWGRYHYDEKGEAVRFVGACFDVTRRKELERRELEKEVLEITARQQQTVGQDLHDGLGQELTGLGLMAQTLAERLPEATLENRIVTRLIAGLDQAQQKLRELARGLIAVEVDTGGLVAALKELAERTTEHSGIRVTLECPEWFEMPDDATATHVFRIAQEAVTNALRHSKPRQIRLTLLAESSSLQLEIKDDGIGIQNQLEVREGLGLRIMKYRAGLVGGVLQIDSMEEGGTTVTLTLPLEQQK